MQRLRELALRGLLISDEPNVELSRLRKRDQDLSLGAWNIYAALYHFMTRWNNVNLRLTAPEWSPGSTETSRRETSETDGSVLQEFIKQHGKPPTHFHTIKRAIAVHRLPTVKRRGQFYDVLMRRKTTRAFDLRKPLALDQLGSILYYVYGCHGNAKIFDDIVGVKKTSPSGGGLHPTEVYPLILNAKALKKGLYHYNVRDHSLELLKPLTKRQARRLADEFTAGQGFPADAQALFIMTSRFYRNYWKYRMHRKAYSVLLMDVAHLSQSFYLVCAQLGLGAFITAAINHVNIEKELGLNGFTEGAIAICGCGEEVSDNRFDPVFRPYVPTNRRRQV